MGARDDNAKLISLTTIERKIFDQVDVDGSGDPTEIWSDDIDLRDMGKITFLAKVLGLTGVGAMTVTTYAVDADGRLVGPALPTQQGQFGIDVAAGADQSLFEAPHGASEGWKILPRIRVLISIPVGLTAGTFDLWIMGQPVGAGITGA
jgi:hypothetical protein